MLADTWIIEYRSPSFDQPVFFLWYTDTDEQSTDQLLTFKSGEILATQSVAELKTFITNHLPQLNSYEQLPLWLDGFDTSALPETTVYDLHYIRQQLAAEDYTSDTLERLVNFVNLCGDYLHQDDDNQYLSTYTDNPVLRDAWDYYYDFIFWPKFNDAEGGAAWERPPLEINGTALFNAFEQLREQLDGELKFPLP